MNKVVHLLLARPVLGDRLHLDLAELRHRTRQDPADELLERVQLLLDEARVVKVRGYDGPALLLADRDALELLELLPELLRVGLHVLELGLPQNAPPRVLHLGVPRLDHVRLLHEIFYGIVHVHHNDRRRGGLWSRNRETRQSRFTASSRGYPPRANAVSDAPTLPHLPQPPFVCSGSLSSGLRGGNELSREAKFRALEIARARLLLRWRSMNEERMPTPLVRSQCVLFRLPCILQSTMYIITSPGLFPLGYPDREPRPVSSGTPAREPKPGRPQGLRTRRQRQRRCRCRWPPGSGPEP